MRYRLCLNKSKMYYLTKLFLDPTIPNMKECKFKSFKSTYWMSYMCSRGFEVVASAVTVSGKTVLRLTDVETRASSSETVSSDFLLAVGVLKSVR